MREWNLFGFTFKKSSKEERVLPSFAPPSNEDGSIVVSEGGAYGTFLDLDGSLRTETELINKYRDMALNPYIDLAIQDIVNESIVEDEDEDVIELILDDIKISDSIKSKINDEFEYILGLLEFNKLSYEIFRRWYIDGRLYYHMIIDPDRYKNEGIAELRYIDPRHIKKIKKVRQLNDPETGIITEKVVEEYFLFNKFGFAPSQQGQPATDAVGAKISKDSVVFASSGILSPSGNLILSYLHKAIRALNQLKSMEDALVIYRISRAPERRIFYVDVGGLPKAKAEQYLRDVMTRFKNKTVYDSSTGEIRNEKRFMTMLEDFWLARRDGSRGTEISTLPGGCLSMDTKVSLLDGRELSIREIEIEMKNGKQLWTYSCDPNTGKIVPGLISWAGVTQKSAKVMKLTLDNGNEIICTPDHQFPVWNKGFMRADELCENESMIPLNRKKEFISENKKLDYEMIFDNESKSWIYTHRLVSDNLKDKEVKYFIYNEDYFNDIYDIRHHKDFNCEVNNQNHRIIKIEYLNEPIEVGTLTIDQYEKYNNFHTFALSVGIFTKNSNLSEIDDLLYFKSALYRSLGVPTSRLESESTFNLGRSTEITRDEVKFAKFITRLRKKFSELFTKLLETQLLLKNICSKDEWFEWKNNIKYKFAIDNYFNELKQIEVFHERINLLNDVENYAGKYFSHDFIRRYILQQTDADIEENDKEIKKEKTDPRYSEDIEPTQQPNSSQEVKDTSNQQGNE